ncbi:SDR family oxidoreductase [Candidatus Dojkabacteria bacterium]|nr:SDR family oxidoreductase [Candidatus Dojkabacteria bacterium]
MKLKDKVVLITGSSSGIGEATAVLFAKEGAKVVVNCLSNEEGAKKVVEACQKVGSESFYVKADVANESEVDDMFKQTVDKFETIDILINNAGGTDKVPFMDAKINDWIDVFKHNILGTMLCSQKAAKIMKENKEGKILNTSSIRGIEHGGREGIMAYSAAKAAVINFTKTLAKELAPDIQVNTIAPGFVWTPNYEKVSKELQEEFINGSLLKRWINVEEIAEGYLYLAQADAITGEVLAIDAGWTMKF